MKLRVILTSIIFACSFQLSAHEFYFSFAEMQYNKKSEQFEISLVVTGHDMEEYLADIGVSIPNLEQCARQPIYLSLIEIEINKGLQILIKGNSLSLDLIGMKINDNDQVVFFMTSRKMQKPNSIAIQYDLMMDFYPLQQNKLTLFKPEGKQFVTFLNTRTKRTIKL